MVPIKVQCGCGQRYAFDVQPVSGRMPGAVKCPICGTDGTAAANSILAQQFPAQAAPAMAVNGAANGHAYAQTVTAAPTMSRMEPPAAAPASRVSSVAAAAPSNAPTHTPDRKRLPGQMDPNQAKIEARSKIMWGDDPADVKKFLSAQGFTPPEIEAILPPILEERRVSVRAAGKARIFKGIGMMIVAVIVIGLLFAVGYIDFKVLGAAVAFGVWGAYKVLSGTITYLSPKSEKGDVSEM